MVSDDAVLLISPPAPCRSVGPSQTEDDGDRHVLPDGDIQPDGLRHSRLLSRQRYGHHSGGRKKRRPAQSVAMVTAGGVRSDLPRQLKDTELSGRLGGRHRSRGLCGGRECENNQITALSMRRLTMQRRLLFVAVK